MVTLFKYGIWAVIMNVLVYVLTGYIDWMMLMLMASHAAMAFQGLYTYRFTGLSYGM